MARAVIRVSPLPARARIWREMGKNSPHEDCSRSPPHGTAEERGCGWRRARSGPGNSEWRSPAQIDLDAVFFASCARKCARLSDERRFNRCDDPIVIEPRTLRYETKPRANGRRETHQLLEVGRKRDDANL